MNPLLAREACASFLGLRRQETDFIDYIVLWNIKGQNIKLERKSVMAVRIRLSRFGRKKKPFYRIVVQNSESRRDGKFLEIVGTYNPMTEPLELTIHQDKLQSWLDKGAEPTTTVKSLLAKNKAVPAAE